MKNVKHIILLVLLISGTVFSCKSDKVEISSEEKIVEPTLSPAEKAEFNEAYSGKEREKDSLQMVTKMTEAYGSVDEERLAEMLQENAKKALEKKKAIEKGLPIAEPRTYMPYVCSVFTQEEIAEMFGVNASDVEESNGNKGSVPSDESRSCFWRWGTTGILLQVSKNPLPDEVNDWCTRYINTKKSSGEKTLQSPDKRFTYVDFKGPGTANIYNEGLGRFYVAKDEKFIISLIFNGNVGKRKQMKIAKKILAKMYDKL